MAFSTITLCVYFFVLECEIQLLLGSPYALCFLQMLLSTNVVATTYEYVCFHMYPLIQDA
jgi:hypothetical protein